MPTTAVLAIWARNGSVHARGASARDPRQGESMGWFMIGFTTTNIGNPLFNWIIHLLSWVIPYYYGLTWVNPIIQYGFTHD